MIRWTNPKVAILENRIKDLESINIALLSENSFLRSEVQDVKRSNSDLLEKIFNISGINKVMDSAPQTINQRVPINTRRGWAAERMILENKAKEDYWLKKKAEVESQSGKVEIEKLETEVGIEGVQQDAS